MSTLRNATESLIPKSRVVNATKTRPTSVQLTEDGQCFSGGEGDIRMLFSSRPSLIIVFSSFLLSVLWLPVNSFAKNTFSYFTSPLQEIRVLTFFDVQELLSTTNPTPTLRRFPTHRCRSIRRSTSSIARSRSPTRSSHRFLRPPPRPIPPLLPPPVSLPLGPVSPVSPVSLVSLVLPTGPSPRARTPIRGAAPRSSRGR